MFVPIVWRDLADEARYCLGRVRAVQPNRRPATASVTAQANSMITASTARLSPGLALIFAT